MAQTPQTITFPDISVKGYGDVSYTLNASASSGLAVRYVSSDVSVATISGNTLTIKKTGAFTVISAFQDGNASVSAAIPVPQLLVVCPKATLTVTAADKTISAGTTTPAFNYSIAGYKKNETASVITGAPIFQSLASSLSAGSYPIVINQGTMSATNYEFQLIDGTLTVSSGTPTQEVNAEDTLFKVFPNPCSNFLTIENLDKEHVSIVDLLGNMILESKCNGNSFVLNVSKIAPGTYIMNINRNNVLISKKLLINR
jgi:hypothetical protein